MPAAHPSCASLAKAADLVSAVSQSVSVASCSQPEHSPVCLLLVASRLPLPRQVDARLSDPSTKMAEKLQPLGAEWLNLLAPHRELCLEFYCTIQG